MAEKDNDRVLFPKGSQRAFITRVQEKLDWKIIDLAKFLGVSSRTITDWKREKFLLSLQVVYRLSAKAKIRIPKKPKIIDRFWYTHKGAHKGGLAVYKKYGRIG